MPVTPLHLTEESKEAIRAFVRAHFPDHALRYKEEAQRNEQLEKQAQLRALQDQLAQMRRHAQAQQWTGYTSVASGTANVPIMGNGPPLVPYIQSSAIDPAVWEAAKKQGPVYYAPTGTGFTTYGPLIPDQGLTLKK
ncbi:MAG: hypothetical protein HRJ53_11410 [Acidobacteria bacterium Pan2503]|uniref:Uncharacterized protein n=1 Tax=Candidatus Acidiferrum panamense TaxID=2741543 RepID=A0A7V8NQF1_9BACT|nr:hypothetical protein [Candidatus Acidoferrum panamensis]